MAKKALTKDLLIGGQKPQGWRDQFDGEPAGVAEPTPVPKPTYRRKTYLISDDLIRRIEVQAEQAGVGVNEMNRYLLSLALDLVERGEHQIEVHTVTKRTLGV